MTHNVLIVDDEGDICDLVAGLLEDEGFSTQQAEDSDAALQAIQSQKPDLIILDVWLEGSALDGLEILAHLKKYDADIPVIMMSGHGTIEMAVKALKDGAYDFIEKPFDSDRLILLAQRALETFTLRKENKDLKVKTGHIVSGELTGISPKIKMIEQQIERVGATESRVLITGNAGTGKSLTARLIHEASPRKDHQFVVLNCAAMRPEHIDQELFGLEQNGKIVKRGALERANKGTLFLDQVSDLAPETQVKILNVLTQQSFTRVGGAQVLAVNARIIAASSYAIQSKIQNGSFREDLYYRLNVVPIIMPDLSERRDDIPDLISIFTTHVCEENNFKAPEFSSEAIEFLKRYSWKGNVRQLKNVVEWSIIMNAVNEGQDISLEMLPADVRGVLSNEGGEVDDTPSSLYQQVMTKPLREARTHFERLYLKSQIDRFDGSISKAAHFVGMERSALHRKVKALGLLTEDATEQLKTGS